MAAWRITSVAPLKGQEAAVSASLEAELGVGLPPVGRLVERGATTVVWTGLGQWFVLGSRPATPEGAACTDQSAAWACATLSGSGSRDVLARLTPLDLRDTAFPVGHAARTMVGHMSCVIVALGADRYGLMVFRSMAGTAAHDLDRAMRLAAARATRD